MSLYEVIPEEFKKIDIEFIRTIGSDDLLAKTLIDELRGAGPHETRWDGTDASGAPVSSGVYFYRMRAGKTSQSRRMVLLK